MTDYSDYAAPLGHNRPEDITELSKLAEAQHKAELKIETLENGLKLAKEELAEIAEKILPEKMDSLGVSTFETSSGVKIRIKEKIRASLAVENRLRGHEWLEQHGCGGMIKSMVVVPFGRDEIAIAHELVEKLKQQHGRLANLERKIEPMTLLAFVREQLAQGKDIPLDIFSVHRQRISEVKI